MKVYALLVMAPPTWGVERAPNGSMQVRTVAAVKSGAEFRRLLEAAGAPVSATYLREYGGETGSSAEIEIATSQPGVLFHAVSSRYGAPFQPAPTHGEPR